MPGKNNTCSIWEAFELVGNITGKPMQFEYLDKKREGDHICYYSDLRKMKAHYPSWDITVSLKETIRQIVKSWEKRLEHENIIAE